MCIMERLVESCREAKNALINTDISWWTYALISCFALSSWITVNGIWSEMPVIVLDAPEKWRLASYIVVIIQLGIIGPLLFSLANKLCPRVFDEKFTIYVIIVIGTLSCVFLSLFWRKTTLIDGSQHSTSFLILVFTLSLVDCTSTVVFLTFMALYDPRYLTALYIGESFSGLLPGLAAIIQGSPKAACNTSTNSSNSTPDSSATGLLFGASSYFIILLAMMLICGLAFLGLNNLSFARKEQKSEQAVNTNTNGYQPEHWTSITDSDKLPIHTPSAGVEHWRSHISKKHILLFIIQAIVCSFTFGIIPSLSPYAYEPYGSVIYHLVASFGPIATAIMCFLIIWFKKTSFVSLFAGFVIFMTGAAYLIFLACQSPTPLLYKSHLGAIMAVLVGVIISMLGTYMRLTISIIMREESKRALYWCGMSIQIGSFLGAISIFPFINVLHSFHQRNAC